MKKRKVTAMLLTMILLVIVTTQTAFAANTVKVTLPSFSVTLNGQTTSNEYSKFPLLVYKDITYFPMTYYDCRLLGLRTEWTAEAGLDIGKNENAFYEYVRETQTFKNAKTQSAQIATGKIRVNGKNIDNTKEQYPLLLFRDVTYFPLTWRFAVEEFGWAYTFDAQNGLVITNPTAAFETPEVWSGNVSEWGSLMGTGDMTIFCSFDGGTGLGSGTPNPHLSLYNITGETIDLSSDISQWEYRIYHLIGSCEELVYRKAIPFYSGELAAQNFAYWSIADTYWKGHIAPGNYRLVVIHPEQYAYRTAGSQQTVFAPIAGNAYAQKFSEIVTVK